MELKDFIKATITGIVSAVNELNEELKETGAVVDPHYGRFTGNGISKMVYSNPNKSKQESLIHEIEFNLTVSEMNRTDGKAGVAIKVIKTGTESQNTVKFSIPVVYSTEPK